MSAKKSHFSAVAIAQPNIAIVKYWGKRDGAGNLPAVGSLSITLDGLTTRTSVDFSPELADDRFSLNGDPAAGGRERVVACLDALRARAGVSLKADVSSENDFPTAAGLASSASGFAALVTAAAAALDLDLSDQERAVLAREASGSAARSIFSGFVEIPHPDEPGGADAIARPILAGTELPLEVTIAVIATGPKEVGSTTGMQGSAETSPFYDAWVRSSRDDLIAARAAVAGRDFGQLAAIGEHSCLKMHAVAQAARPGVVYWQGPTVACMHRVRGLRASGVPVFFTIDAGPQLKAISLPGYSEQVAETLGNVPGVLQVLNSRLGDGARVIAGAQDEGLFVSAG